MKRAIFRLAILLSASAAPFIFQTLSFAQTAQTAPAKPVLKGFPFTNESLSYVALWPSGLNAGEAHMSATSSSAGWRFDLTMNASIPGFTVQDSYHSTATPDLCSVSFTKDLVHGSRKTKETDTVDKENGTVTRSTANSDGKSKLNVSDCIHDALTFLYYARREMGQGRVPTSQEIVFGAIYNGMFQYAGAETIPVGTAKKPTVTDKLICHIKGTASEIQFEAYFDRDPARTLVSVRVPLPVGKFSLELVR